MSFKSYDLHLAQFESVKAVEIQTDALNLTSVQNEMKE